MTTWEGGKRFFLALLTAAAPYQTTAGFKVQWVLHCFLVKFNLCVIYFTAPPPHHHASSSDPPCFACPEIGNLQKELIVIDSPKLTTAADCELQNTKEIRNHLTPECTDQCY